MGLGTLTNDLKEETSKPQVEILGRFKLLARELN